jgi:hypothetical protein
MTDTTIDIEKILMALHEDTGDGDVIVHPTFMELPSLQQADLLQDWLEHLQEMYDSVIAGTFLTDMGGSGINQPPASGGVH